MTSKGKPPNPIVITFLVVVIIASIVVGSWAAILAIKRASDESAGNTTSIKAVRKAASAALTVAESQRRTILAVCVRFNSDEQISEDQTTNLLAVERQFTSPNVPITERRYHMARLKVLIATLNVRKQKIKVDCNKAMQSHINSATPVPLASPPG